MARFGQSFINSLTNPSYADQMTQVGMLGGSLMGRHRKAEEEKQKEEQQRMAQQSIYSILNSGDPNDPNVAASAQAVGSQMGQDPEAIQKMINDARTMGINQEKLQVQKDRLEMEQAEAVYKTEQRELAQENQAVASGIEQAIANGVDPEQALMKVPADKREYARAYLEKMSEYQTKIDDLKNKAKSNRRFDDATLAEVQELLGPEGEKYIKLYKSQHREETGLSSNTRLLDMVDDAYRKLANKEAVAETGPENPTNGERAVAEVAVRQALGRVTVVPLLRGKDQRIRTAVAERVASLLRTQPDKTPTDAEIVAIYDEIKNQAEAVAPAGVTSTGVTWSIKG